MANITSKEYLKSLIVKGFKGEKIDSSESAALEKEIINFTAADWRKLKILGKEIAKEEADKFIEGNKDVPTVWKNESKQLTHALVNFSAALFSEEIILQAIRLEKEKASLEERGRVLAPLLAANLEKMAARKPVYQVKNYHKAEKNFAKRFKAIKSMITLAKMGHWRSYKGKPDEAKVRDFLGKFLKNCKNLSADEVKVFKEKGKAWIKASLANSNLSQSPEAEKLILTFLTSEMPFWMKR